MTIHSDAQPMDLDQKKRKHEDSEEEKDEMDEKTEGELGESHEDIGEEHNKGKEEVDSINWDQADQLLQNGPFVYELFSVLIHRGSALGGHYYAYIKSFEREKWFEFNDSSVTEINESDLRKTFGEDPEDRPRSGMMQLFHSSGEVVDLALIQFSFSQCLHADVSPN
jgi:ubiquitin carboxyl-terminal hydrolase 47